MKNIFLKIIMGIMLVTILNTGYVLANAVARPDDMERVRNKDLQKIDIKEPSSIKQHTNKATKEKDAQTQRIIITGIFISGAGILIILAGIFTFIYVITQKNKFNSSHNTESSNQPK